MPPPISLPISQALRETSSSSISDLFSRDVEFLSDADIDRIIAEERAHIERLAAAAEMRPVRGTSRREKNAPAPSSRDDLEGFDL